MIPEWMHAVQKIRSTGPSNRRVLNVMVFIRIGYEPVVIIICGSKFEGMQPLLRYFYPPTAGAKVGKEHTALCADEYQNCLKEAIPKLTMNDRRTSKAPVVLLQDVGTPHTAASTARFCADFKPRPIQLVQLPAHCPDLTPLDANLFGTVKGKWRTATTGKRMSWADKCKCALALLKQENPDAYIRAMPLRWRACQEMQGWHIEAKLLELQAKKGKR
jgi:hypothetical protein